MLTLGRYLSRIHTCRCGVIPYIIKNGKIYYLLARHKDTNELGDFGGGVRKYEFALSGGLREFNEESRGIFSDQSKNINDRVNDIAIVDNDNIMAILFLPLNLDCLDDKIQDKFSNKNQFGKYSNEISELVWFDEKGFEELLFYPKERLTGNIMWRKIQLFIKRFYNKDMIEALKLSANR